MTITTTRNSRRLGLASGAIAALLLLASACGTETAASQAPGSISGPRASSTEKQSQADREECLVAQAKHQDPGSSCTESTQAPEATQPQYLAPSGRPVPLPGQDG